MPGGEASWPQFDYYTIHPDRLKPVMATMGIEHMGGRQTVELGPDGNRYADSTERPEDGGVITSLMDIHTNNVWLVEATSRAATHNHRTHAGVEPDEATPD